MMNLALRAHRPVRLVLAATGLLLAQVALAAPVAPDPRWPFRVAPAKTEAHQGGVGLVLEAKPTGAVASQVLPGSPAAQAGIQAGDVLTAVDAWTVPEGVKVPELADHIRGEPGSSCQIEVRRSGVAIPLRITVQRTSMERLFPQTSREILKVHDGLAIVATGQRHAIGVRFSGKAQIGEPLAYQWTVAAPNLALVGQPLSAGLVTVDASAGAVVQVADLRLDLKVLPGSGEVFVSASNLPLHLPSALEWQTIAPPYPTLIKPRSAPAKQATRWAGTDRAQLQALLDGAPLAGRRVTLKIADAQGLTQDARTVLTDREGRFEVALPAGRFKVMGLQPSLPGAGRDIFFEADLGPSDLGRALDTAASDPRHPVVLALQKKPLPQTISVAEWAKDARVGQGIAQLDVQRWFHLDRKAPETLKGKVLLLYVWATWCGPCKQTSPMVAEINARLGSRGLEVIEASIDRDETAIEEFAAEVMHGAPPIAWVGPDAMTALDIESVPTLYVIDGQGKIRGMHRGTGWTLDALEAWLNTLLDEGKK